MATPEKILIDRIKEDGLFREMLGGRGRAHVLLIQAQSGMGKSYLLDKWWEDCEGLPRGRVNLKLMTYSVTEILGELCQCLSSERFNRYYERCQEFARQSGINIERSTFLNSPIEASLAGVDSEQRKLRRQLLTDAFFADLTGLVSGSQSAVLLFDTYETASDEVKDWISGLFLTRVYRHRGLVVVIAGREIPQVDRDWSDLCLHQTLTKLEKDHLREYVRRLQLSFSDEVIDVLYDTTNDGHPFEVSLQLHRLLAKRGGAYG